MQLSVGPGSVAPVIPASNVRGDRLDQAICAVPLGMAVPDVLYHSSRPGVVAQVPKRRFSGADWPLNNQVVEGLNDWAGLPLICPKRCARVPSKGDADVPISHTIREEANEVLTQEVPFDVLHPVLKPCKRHRPCKCVGQLSRCCSGGRGASCLGRQKSQVLRRRRIRGEPLPLMTLRAIPDHSQPLVNRINEPPRRPRPKTTRGR